MTIGKTGILTGLPMHRMDVYRMIRRRAADTSRPVLVQSGLSGDLAAPGWCAIEFRCGDASMR
jgi:hypothetical protein